MALLRVNLILLVFFFSLCHLGNTTSNETMSAERQGKIFSLFSIVQFKNIGCKSQSTMSTGQSNVRNGTCFTSSECSNKGGTASGNCAAGFGVCCLFLVSSTGSTINQNCTYLRNPSFPSVYSSTSSLSYTINKCSSDVCWLRLDFETFTTIGPTDTKETTGYSCPDTFKVTTNTGQSIPTICGKNSGQHIYIDLGTASTDTATLAFTFSTSTSTSRTWEIKVSQITCSNPNRPPDGCLQYYSNIVGRITTFNWLSTTSSHLPTQDYTACIRRASGFCCIEYVLCQDATNPWAIDQTVATAQVDSLCTLDHVSIPGSSTSCSTKGQNLYSKYCGSFLGILVDSAINAPALCDCTPPFTVHFHTDSINDAAGTAGGNRGVCFDYMQLPCSNN